MRAWIFRITATIPSSPSTAVAGLCQVKIEGHAEASDLLQHHGPRRDGRAYRRSRRRLDPARRARTVAAQPSAGLPDLRQGRGMLVAELFDALRQPRRAHDRAPPQSTASASISASGCCWTRSAASCAAAACVSAAKSAKTGELRRFQSGRPFDTGYLRTAAWITIIRCVQRTSVRSAL